MDSEFHKFIQDEISFKNFSAGRLKCCFCGSNCYIFYESAGGRMKIVSKTWEMLLKYSVSFKCHKNFNKVKLVIKLKKN